MSIEWTTWSFKALLCLINWTKILTHFLCESGQFHFYPFHCWTANINFDQICREWYSYHFPELIKVVPDNYTFARCAQYIKNRKELSEESLPELTEIVMDAGVAQSVLDASRSSMGKSNIILLFFLN